MIGYDMMRYGERVSSGMRRSIWKACADNGWCTLHSQWVDDFSDENDHWDQNQNCIQCSDLIWIQDLVGSRMLVLFCGGFCSSMQGVAVKCQMRVKLVDMCTTKHCHRCLNLRAGALNLNLPLIARGCSEDQNIDIFWVGKYWQSSPRCRLSSPLQHSSPFLRPASQSFQTVATES